MSHKLVVFGCAATLMVTSAMAATEPSTTKPAQAPASAQASKPAASPPSTAPATQVPPSATPGSMPPEHGAAKPQPKKPTAPEKLVDVNNASFAVLKNDLSISDEVAEKIVAARPLCSKTDLVTKAGLPEGIYVSLRHRIAINDMKKPKQSCSIKPEPKKTEPKKTESSKPVASTTEAKK